MCRQELWDLNTPTFLQHLKPLPQPHRRPRIVTRLGHHHQPHVIRLHFLTPAHWQLNLQRSQCRQPHDAGCSQTECAGPRTTEEEETANGEPKGADLGDALARVAGGCVSDLVAEDRGESVFVVADVEEATVGEDFTSGNDEGICCAF